MLDLDVLDQHNEADPNVRSWIESMMPQLFECIKIGRQGYFHKCALMPLEDPDTEGSRWCFSSVVGNIDLESPLLDLLELYNTRMEEMLPVIGEVHDEINKLEGRIRKAQAKHYGKKFLKGLGKFAGVVLDIWIKRGSGGGSEAFGDTGGYTPTFDLPDVFRDAGFK